MSIMTPSNKKIEKDYAQVLKDRLSGNEYKKCKMNKDIEKEDEDVRPAPYYIVIEEWFYPGQGYGHGIPWETTYDSREKAFDAAELRAKEEVETFERKTGVDALGPDLIAGAAISGSYMGYIISPKNGLDKWFYMVKIIEVTPNW